MQTERQDGKTAKGEVRAPAIASQCDRMSQLIDIAARDHGDASHLAFRDRQWTYAESRERVLRLAAGLRATGIGKGDRVGLMLPNMPAYPLLCFALWRIGAVGVGVNLLYPDGRVADLLAAVDAKLLVVTDRPEDIARAEGQAARRAVQILSCAADASDLLAGATVDPAPGTLASLLVHGVDTADAAVTRDDLAMLQFTGGTTGLPKAAMLTHGNLLSAIAMGAAGMTDVRQAVEGWSAIAPMTHITGLVLYVGVCAAFAGNCVIMERFDPESLLGQLKSGTITVLTAIPTMVTALLAQPGVESVDWGRMSLVMAGGAPIPIELQKRFIAVAGRPVLQAYGMTETAAAAAMLGTVENDEQLASVGRAVPGVELSIRDLDDSDRVCAVGQLGEICLRGANVITGYLGDDRPERLRTTDGFFRTGDVGRVDADGLLYIEDRVKDLIICSGYNVYPRMVEEAVQSIDGVREVVAVGLPDSYRGETVAVALVKDGDPLTLDEMKTKLADRLSPVEMPKRLFLFDSLPKTENFKLSRSLIRQTLLDRPAD